MEKISKKKIILIAAFILIVITIIFCFISLSKNKTEVPSQQQTVPQVVDQEKEKISVKAENKLDETIKEPEPIPLPEGVDRFIVSTKDTNENIANNLFDKGYTINKESIIKLISGKDGKGTVTPGGYKISKEMNDSQLVQILKGKPYMKWVVIPEGLRKEEIAKLLALNLGWTSKQKDEWIKTDTTKKPEYTEGVYFPNTYLIPIDELPSVVASRLISKFNENFSPYLSEFTAKNIRWTTALTLASIVQREATNAADTPLIAGILWNRLNTNMKLGVDATLQYIRGDKGKGWWAPISVADKKTESPYNTYLNTGLPPHPISNPGIPAIEAVLNPAKTDCLYYIHDRNHITHCSVTYEEHQANIEKYLKN